MDSGGLWKLFENSGTVSDYLQYKNKEGQIPAKEEKADSKAEKTEKGQNKEEGTCRNSFM